MIIDLFSRQVVGWSMQPHLRRDLLIDALHMAWFRRRPPPTVDLPQRPRQPSADFQQALAGYGMCNSMSRKGNYWGTAPAESFWGSLKVGRLRNGLSDETRKMRARSGSFKSAQGRPKST